MTFSLLLYYKTYIHLHLTIIDCGNKPFVSNGKSAGRSLRNMRVEPTPRFGWERKKRRQTSTTPQKSFACSHLFRTIKLSFSLQMNSIYSFILSLMLLFGSSRAFLPLGHSEQRLLNNVLNSQKLSDIDLMAIENVAELCLNAEDLLASECDLEEHEALVNQLTAQKALLEDQLKYLNNLLMRLNGEELTSQDLSP